MVAWMCALGALFALSFWLVSELHDVAEQGIADRRGPAAANVFAVARQHLVNRIWSSSTLCTGSNATFRSRTAGLTRRSCTGPHTIRKTRIRQGAA